MIKSKKGFTLIELIISAAILTVVSTGVFTSLNFYIKLTNRIVVNRLTSQHLVNLTINIRSNPGLYQASYDLSDTQINALLDEKNLPLAFTNNKIVKAENCKNCIGKLGFVVMPHELIRGLYVVRYKILHPSLADKNLEL